MKKVALTIELTLIAPFLTKSTDIGAFGIDVPFARSDGKKLQFPRKLIKGCLRQALEEISDATGNTDKSQIEKWFGDKSLYEKISDAETIRTNTSVEPKRGKLFFSDFTTGETGEKKTRIKISIDSERGAVKENHLMVIESPFKPQERITFTGNITYFAEDNVEGNQIKNWVIKGLKWITNLGALENINFGRLETVSVTENNEKEFTHSAQPSTGAESFTLILKPKESFCISKRRTTENLFESEEFISGGVIKGCIAETIRLIKDKEETKNSEFKELLENLHAVRFTHAFPTETKVRPLVFPLSLVKISVTGNEKGDFKKEFRDVWNYENAILIKNESPAFSVDWKRKDYETVNKDFGWKRPKTVLSVQTAIENNKAKEGQLYAYEKINPNGFEWLGRMNLSLVEDERIRNAVEQQLQQLFTQGLFGLGKTKAECKVEMLPENSFSDKKISDINARDGKFIITLQTPFLLCDPQELNESSGRDELLRKYRETWKQISDESLELNHFFASQSLAGGEYLHKRFQSNNPYNPFLLTDAGSVFILNVTDETKANNKIKDWIKGGLPLPDWAKNLYLKNISKENYWKHLPFIPENGFGEIAVNLDTHRENAPEKAEVIEI